MARGDGFNDDKCGTTKISVTLGRAIEVSNRSFEPADYTLETTFQGGDSRNRVTKSDLVRGYCSYGHLIGE